MNNNVSFFIYYSENMCDFYFKKVKPHSFLKEQ